jgi:hypothetical protein
MERSDESETAEPQKERRRWRRRGQPRERTSVAVSERAQQKDCWWGSGVVSLLEDIRGRGDYEGKEGDGAAAQKDGETN